VRELRNRVARHIALGDLCGTEQGGATVEERTEVASHAPEPVSPNDLVERILAERLPLPRARQRLVDEFERRYIARVLEEHGGNVARAASASGIARRYFQILKARR
jgi:transcriptional regulator with GAF, ATPase, and Fis domain